MKEICNFPQLEVYLTDFLHISQPEIHVCNHVFPRR